MCFDSLRETEASMLAEVRKISRICLGSALRCAINAAMATLNAAVQESAQMYLGDAQANEDILYAGFDKVK